MPGYEFHGYYKKEDRFDKHLKLRGVLLEQKKIENAKKRFFHLHTKLTGQKCCQVCHSDDISIASIHHSVEIGVWYKSYKNEKTGYYDQAGYYGALLEWLKNNPKNAKIINSSENCRRETSWQVPPYYSSSTARLVLYES